jgi:hypothetical protein
LLGSYSCLLLRFGLEAGLEGNRRLYTSTLELPTGDIGYQYATRRWFFAALVGGGYTLTGLYRSEHSRAWTLGDFGYGGELVASWQRDGTAEGPRIFTRLTSRRIDLDEGPLDAGRFDLCGGGAEVTVCTGAEAFLLPTSDRAGGHAVHLAVGFGPRTRSFELGAEP